MFSSVSSRCLRRNAKRTKPRASTLRVEQLETRLLLAGSAPDLNIQPILGTEGDDAFNFVGGATPDDWTVEVNGVAQTLAGGTTGVSFDGLGGEDTVTLTGTDGVETATLTPNEVTFVDDTGNNTGVTAVNCEIVSIDGQGGADVASFYDSAGDDTLITREDSVEFSGTGFDQTLTDFTYVHAYAKNGGDDVASMYDSTANETFIGTPTYSKMYCGRYYYRAKFFEIVHAYATTEDGGADTARMFDSAGSDRFIATPEYAKMYGSSYFCRAKFFESATGYASAGGTDIARLWDGAGDDKLVATPTKARLFNATANLTDNFDVTARGFEHVVAHSTDGFDTARMFGEVGVKDVFRCRANKSTFKGAGQRITARDFRSVNVFGNAGEADVAKLHDTAGNDHLEANGNWASLARAGAAYPLYLATDLSLVRAYATTGTNTTNIDAAVDFLMIEGDWQQ